MTTEQFGDGGKAIIEFAKARTEPILKIFEDPMDIAPPVMAIIGHNAQGGSEIFEIDFDRDTWRDRPRRRKGTISVTTLESFIALVNRQSGEQSVIFADDSVKPSEGRIEFSEEHKDEGGGPLDVPAAFHLFIPVYRRIIKRARLLRRAAA